MLWFTRIRLNQAGKWEMSYLIQHKDTSYLIDDSVNLMFTMDSSEVFLAFCKKLISLHNRHLEVAEN